MPVTERVTITLPADLLSAIDQFDRNRSRFIAEVVQREVIRRRRAALMDLIRSPHPETTQSADAGLGDWTSDLPDALAPCLRSIDKRRIRRMFGRVSA